MDRDDANKQKAKSAAAAREARLKAALKANLARRKAQARARRAEAGESDDDGGTHKG